VYEDGNIGHRPGVKGGYFPVPPVDSLQDLRSAMCNTLEEHGPGRRSAITTKSPPPVSARSVSSSSTLVKKADEVLILKYVVQNVAHAYGKTATFMPKPLVGDNGSNGMHVHQSLAEGRQKRCSPAILYGGLSETALYYIGGIIKHAKALNAFCNASHQQLQASGTGLRAPVMLAYSARNRSASIRVPHVPEPQGRAALKCVSRLHRPTRTSRLPPC
jgi:glutamine synthetase